MSTWREDGLRSRWFYKQWAIDDLDIMQASWRIAEWLGVDILDEDETDLEIQEIIKQSFRRTRKTALAAVPADGDGGP